MNQVSLIGRITKEVELRTTTSGKSVVSFTLAIDRQKKDSGTDFIDCVAWDSTAVNMEKYVSKGDLLGVSGRLQSRSYEDKTGRTVYVTEVVALSVQFCGGKRAAAPAVVPEQQYQAAPADFEEITDDEDLPF